MKLPLTLLALFAVLTLCLPLAAVTAPPRGAAKQAATANGNAQASATPTAPPTREVRPATTKTDDLPTAGQGKGLQSDEAAGANATEQIVASALPKSIKLPNEFRILNTATGKVQRVKRTDYVRGAVSAEMPPSFHTQALTAQAVAAHTYALRCYFNEQKSPTASLKGADFAADPDNWRGYITEAQAKERFGNQFEVYWGKLSAAADEGSRYILLYNEEPIVAAYHSISAGATESAANVWQGEAPYLAPVESFGDTLAPNYETTVSFSTDEVQSCLLAEDASILLNGEPAQWITVKSRSESGYVLAAQAGSSSLTGLDIRRIFGLRSSDFTVAESGGNLTFTVRGYGHGVGLSQYGADYMARQGSRFDEILSHYYTNCIIAKPN